VQLLVAVGAVIESTSHSAVISDNVVTSATVEQDLQIEIPSNSKSVHSGELLYPQRCIGRELPNERSPSLFDLAKKLKLWLVAWAINGPTVILFQEVWAGTDEGRDKEEPLIVELQNVTSKYPVDLPQWDTNAWLKVT
jgi:hypothetical protein